MIYFFSARKRALGEALCWSGRQGFLRWTYQVHEQWTSCCHGKI